MTSYDDTKVQLTINRMTEECYENVPDKSSTELYLISQDPTSIAKIDLDAQSRTDAEISSIQSDLNGLQSDLNGLSTDVQEVSSQTTQNAQDIADISANLTHSTVRRWEYVEYNGLTFTAEEANSTVAMQKVGSAPDVSLEYSTGDGWNDFIVGQTTVTLANVGDQMVIRAKTTNSAMGSRTSTYNRFVMTGKIASSDSIMYLLKNDGDLSAISSWGCFNHLFYGCTSLTQAPELPALTLAESCYWSMFEKCTSLTTPPELPAMSLTFSCYSVMFSGCTSLLEAPELPATTLAHSCYQSMFDGCTSLTTAPELPATVLSDGCYHHMFYGCTSLTQAPELPATTLARNCYQSMFNGCTSLTTAPELPATVLSDGCYHHMFYGCTSLTQAPELPATVLSDGCYHYMFYGCTSLAEAPELPATTLTKGCYNWMFYRCRSLNTIKIAYTGNFSGDGVPENAFNNWVDGVASTGTFYYDGEDTTRGASAIPTGWEVREITLPGLTFTAEQANSTVAMTAVGSAPSVSLEYSTDNGSTWSDFIVGTTTVTLANVGDKMAMRAKTTNSGMGSSGSNYNQFAMTGKIAVSDSIMYLLKNDGDLDTIPTNFCFYELFFNCTSLATPPELPATTLAELSYFSMFQGCSSLTTAPELPATTLARNCYQFMFDGCTSLVNPPSELPALSVPFAAYGDMFAGTAITKSPYIRATSVDGAWGMASMFKNCSSLNEIKMDYIGNFSGSGVPTYAFTTWVDGVASTGTFYYNGSDTTRGTYAIPENWTIQSF